MGTPSACKYWLLTFQFILGVTNVHSYYMRHFLFLLEPLQVTAKIKRHHIRWANERTTGLNYNMWCIILVRKKGKLVYFCLLLLPMVYSSLPNLFRPKLVSTGLFHFSFF